MGSYDYNISKYVQPYLPNIDRAKGNILALLGFATCVSSLFNYLLLLLLSIPILFSRCLLNFLSASSCGIEFCNLSILHIMHFLLNHFLISWWLSNSYAIGGTISSWSPYQTTKIAICHINIYQKYDHYILNLTKMKKSVYQTYQVQEGLVLLLWVTVDDLCKMVCLYG